MFGKEVILKSQVEKAAQEMASRYWSLLHHSTDYKDGYYDAINQYNQLLKLVSPLYKKTDHFLEGLEFGIKIDPMK